MNNCKDKHVAGIWTHSKDVSDGWGERRGHIYKEELKFLKFLRERGIYRDNSSYL